MARISGVDLPREKRVEIGLTYIYGIGLSSSKRILAEANVDPDTRVRDLTDDEVKRLSAVINETQVVEGDLRREIALNIKRLKEIRCNLVIRCRIGLGVLICNLKIVSFFNSFFFQSLQKSLSAVIQRTMFRKLKNSDFVSFITASAAFSTSCCHCHCHYRSQPGCQHSFH